MEGTLNNILMIISAGEFLLGILGNGFIVLVNCIDWIRSRKFSLIDFILTCLATSRIFVLCLMISMFYPGIFESHQVLEVSFYFFWNLSNSLGTWCATCLSVFYFLKLSNFSHPFFLWLKCRRTFLYPSVHPFILILGNGKLRQTSVNLLRQIESCIKRM
ncbi:unnamed protein product [Rangifer tarandus platyrhynchus]|uniref:Uncharacterized protein n=1 Tax=Rangifer tarandus platyrhynchus TaxID=3082113 RepID=A0AC59Z7K4_RANTA